MDRCKYFCVAPLLSLLLINQEFPPERVEIVQTGRSLNIYQSPDTDDSPTGHSTATASKAAGAKYGSAKAAKLVVIKMADFVTDEVGSVFNFGTYI